MKETKQHTPGPWSVLEPYRGTNHYPIGHDRGDGSIEILAEATGTGGTNDETTVNAQLIASAPELLAALVCLESHARTGLDQSATHQGLERCDALAKAREAIARATGN